MENPKAETKWREAGERHSDFSEQYTLDNRGGLTCCISANLCEEEGLSIRAILVS